MRVQMCVALAVFTFVVAGVPASAQTVKTVKVRLLEPNTVLPLLPPLTLQVNSNDAARLKNVQVRIFPKKQPKTIAQNPLDVAANGCFIFSSRVVSYSPTLFDPHVRFDEIHTTDLKCAGGVLVTTDFVLVVESDDNTSERFLRIEKTQLPQYFRYAQSFRVQPPPGIKCGIVRAAAATKHKGGGGGRQDASPEATAAVEAEAPPICITKVEH